MNILFTVALVVIANVISGSIAYFGAKIAARYFFNKEV